MGKKHVILIGVGLLMISSGCATIRNIFKSKPQPAPKTLVQAPPRWNPPCDFIRFTNLEKAWQLTQGGDARVAILDWQFDLGAPELSGVFLKPASSVPGIGHDQDRKVDQGHWMSQLVHVVAPQAKIIPIKVRHLCVDAMGNEDKKNACWKEYVPQAIQYAVDQKADVIMLAHLGFDESPTYREAINYASVRNVVYVDPQYRGSQKQVIRPEVFPDDQHPQSGRKNATIRACPYNPFMAKAQQGDGYSRANTAALVTGVVALMKSVYPKITTKEVREILVESARTARNYKVLDAYRAVHMAKNYSELSTH